MIIKLIRHGESKSNTGETNPQEKGDFDIPLTQKGQQQVFNAGKIIGKEFIESSLLYCSPYKRTEQTMNGILAGAEVAPDKVKIYQDPRIRELDFGYDNVLEQQQHREIHGWFYYRYKGGESPADCYDRTSAFIDSIMRQVERKKCKNIVIVTHGVTIRCFVTRFLHLTVNQFDTIKNPSNGDLVTIYPADKNHQGFKNGSWAVDGLRFYDES